MKKFSIALVLGLVFAAVSAFPAMAEPAEHVTICHRTGSATNPYVQISPAAAGVYHGHLDHAQVGNGLGGDIIPPFEYQGETYSLNWDAEGQAIFNNGCIPLEEPPGGNTVAPPGKCDGNGSERPKCQEIVEPPDGLAFTGINDVIPFAALAIALLILGGYLYRRSRREA